MPKEIRVGIIGCGKIADVQHVPEFKGVKGVRITQLMDVRPEAMESLRRKHDLDAETHTDLESILATDIDAVSICTPNIHHYPQTIKSLRAGKHVLCEKPMAGVTAEATKMIAAAQQAGKVLHINQTLHYLPLYQAMVKAVHDGTIGDVMHIRCLRAHSSSPDVEWSPGARWFVQASSAGGVVRDIGVHMAELMQWIAGPILNVAAFTKTRRRDIDVPDNAASLFQFESGATGVLELSWTVPVGGVLLEVYGTKGTLRHGFDTERPFEIRTPGPEGKPPRVKHPRVPEKVRDSHQCFIDAILGKAPSPTPGELGRSAVALCEAILRSGATSKIVPVRPI
jgi:UDP-N-acetylglucosamine 3-dehydrogenase